ncbi:15869_t:CDS:2, partial [Cetraspora pellucida]
EIERFIIHMAKSKNAIGLFVRNIGFKDEAKDDDNYLNFDVIVDNLEFEDGK